VETGRYVVAVIEALEAAAIPYMIVGSLSASAYGVTRSTKDADFVLELGSRSIAEVTQRLGPEFVLDPQLSFETNTGTLRQVISVGDIGFQIELFRLSNDPHDQERFRRRRQTFAPFIQREVFLPTPEDVVVTKLRWILTAARSKDRDDVVDVLSVQRNSLDWNYIHRWCDEHGTRAILDELRTLVSDV
jgi:hypothetical protein